MEKIFCDGCGKELEMRGESGEYLFGKEYPGMYSIDFQISTHAGSGPGDFCKPCCASLFETLGTELRNELNELKEDK